MAKKKSWIGRVRKIFVPRKKAKLFGWFCGLLGDYESIAISAPQRTLKGATQKHKQHMMNIAMATAAAVDAAAAAANAAAEVVRLTERARFYLRFPDGINSWAARKIQSAFRGYLARNALRALKGVVSLQAIIRGRAVRRHLIHISKCLPSNPKTISKAWESNSVDPVNRYKDKGKKNMIFSHIREYKEKEVRSACNDRRIWDSSSSSNGDAKAIWLKRRNAFIKRERMKQYSFSHQEKKYAELLDEDMPRKEFEKESCPLREFMDTEASYRKKVKSVYSDFDADLPTMGSFGTSQVRLSNLQDRDLSRQNLPNSLPRRTFSRANKFLAADTNSKFPTYMIATESAKAKAKLLSTPRQRMESFYACSSRSSSYRNACVPKWIKMCSPANISEHRCSNIE